MPVGRWENTEDFLAQANHFGYGALFVSLIANGGYESWWGVLLVALIFGAKEFWGDTKALSFLPYAGFWEQDSLIGSATDFFFYLVGAFIGRLAVACFWAGLIVGCVWFAGMMLYYWVQNWSEYD